MNGRRIYHARGKILGGSSSINGMIFQRGNPLDYERWAADPGMETWSFADCLPYFKRMEDCTRGGGGRPVARPRRPAHPRARARDEPPVPGLVRGRRGGRLPADRPTSTATARRVRAVRPEHPPRPALVGVAGVPPAGPRPAEPRGPDADVRDPRRARGRPGDRRRDREGARRRHRADPRRRGHPRRRLDQLAAAAALLAASARPTDLRRLGIDVAADLPGVGANLQDHLEVYIQHARHPAGLDAARRDAEMAPAVHRRAVAVPAARARRDEPLRGRRLRPEQRRRRLPEPDVPFPAARDPLRRHGRRAGPRLPGPRRADVLRRPGHRALRSTDPRTTRRSASTTSRPTRTGASGSRRSGSPGASSASRRSRRTTAARRRPAPSVETDDEILDWVARDAETALHPSCTARMGTDAASVLDPLTMRVHGVDGLRVVDASSCRMSRTATSTRR